MNKTNLVTVALFGAISLTPPVFAQNPQAMTAQQQMKQHNNMLMHDQAMQRPAPKSLKAPQRPLFAEFPTPDELARMTPPEPITAEKIKKRFAKRRARVEETIAQDRKQAEKYAKNFARFQKHQADQLARIMARAEKQREALLNRINRHEQQVLENFRNRNESRKVEPSQY